MLDCSVGLEHGPDEVCHGHGLATVRLGLALGLLGAADLILYTYVM